MTDQALRAALVDALADPLWLDAALAWLAAEPGAISELFPAAGRRCGRGPLPRPGPDEVGWSVDDAARTVLLTALRQRGEALAAAVTRLYRHGDAAEKRGVLRALPRLDLADGAVELLRDALRTNDPRLVAAALGPYARHLDAAAWRQAVLKCVFMGIELAAIDALDERADAELARMLGDLAAERRAAGRSVPADARSLLDRLSARLEKP
jgi:hypothetical protein